MRIIHKPCQTEMSIIEWSWKTSDYKKIYNLKCEKCGVEKSYDMDEIWLDSDLIVVEKEEKE